MATREKITPYFYAAGDDAKAHLDAKALPVGKTLVYVNALGHETLVVKGASFKRTTAELQASWKDALSKPKD